MLTVGFQALVGTIAFGHANSVKVQTLGVTLGVFGEDLLVWFRSMLILRTPVRDELNHDSFAGIKSREAANL